MEWAKLMQHHYLVCHWLWTDRLFTSSTSVSSTYCNEINEYCWKLNNTRITLTLIIVRYAYISTFECIFYVLILSINQESEQCVCSGYWFCLFLRNFSDNVVFIYFSFDFITNITEISELQNEDCHMTFLNYTKSIIHLLWKIKIIKAKLTEFIRN